MKKLFLMLSLFAASNVFAVTPATTTTTTTASGNTTTTTVTADLDISDAWARPTWGDPKTTAIYMKITNKGKDNYLLSASTDVAKTAEIHQTVVENEVAHMAAVQKIATPAVNTVSFEPGGIHIMLVNVTKDLKAGDSFDLKLQFENGGERIVKVLVKDNAKNAATTNSSTSATPTAKATTTTVTADLDISDAWARPTWGDPKTTAIYMKITNKGKDNYLLSASTDVAKTAEIHQTVVENEVAHMAAVQKIAIPAVNTVSFEPGGIHIMLVNVTKDLKAGDSFDLKLQFENGGERIVKVLVKDNAKNAATTNSSTSATPTAKATTTTTTTTK